MPKIRRSRKKPPDGWELIEPTLEELEQKMREGNCLFQLNSVLFAFHMSTQYILVLSYD